MDERRARLPRLEYPPALPILLKKEEIVAAVRKHPVVVITGETGSGKTTQIPKMCLEAGRGLAGLIGCTQPRRIAATTVARRIAEEMGEEVGHSVGYKIRFDDRTPRDAFLKIMTDGILLMEAQTDPLLRAYDTIIIDEAHERSLNIDFILGDPEKHPRAAARSACRHHLGDDRYGEIFPGVRSRPDHRGVGAGLSRRGPV